MRTIVIASALSLLAFTPASAQLFGGGMGEGMGSGMRSCVLNGQFVPCPPAGGMMGGPGMRQGGMAMGEPGMERRMTRREMREQRRMARQQAM